MTKTHHHHHDEGYHEGERAHYYVGQKLKAGN
jgi:hypothetical protein